MVGTAFKLMDADEDGVTSYEEFLYLHKAFNMKQEMINYFWNPAELNGIGVRDYQETYKSFVKLYLYI